MRIACASSAIGIEDVFEATIASSETTSAIAPITASFSCSSSGTASITRSASPIASSRVVRSIRSRTAAAPRSVELAAADRAGQRGVDPLAARPSAASSTSRTITGIPATAAVSAMPVPMNPAPTMATDSISDMGGSLTWPVPLAVRLASWRSSASCDEPVEQLGVTDPAGLEQRGVHARGW